MSGCTQQWFSIGSVVLDPFAVKIVDVVARQDAVLPRRFTSRLIELDDKESQRGHHQQHEEDDHAHNFHLEAGQSGSSMPNSIADHSRKENRLSSQDRPKSKNAASEKSEPPSAVGMEQVQVKRQPPHMPEKPIPEEETIIPAKNEETEDRQADQHIPISSGRKMRHLADL